MLDLESMHINFWPRHNLVNLCKHRICFYCMLFYQHIFYLIVSTIVNFYSIIIISA